MLLTFSTRPPDLKPGETTQNIVEIPTVQELVICFGNFQKSKLWSGSTTNSQVATCGVEFHVHTNASCFSAYFPARCTASVVSCVCQTLVSARLLTYLEDSSTSTFSKLKTFAHHISKQIHKSMNNFTWYWRFTLVGRTGERGCST